MRSPVLCLVIVLRISFCVSQGDGVPEPERVKVGDEESQKRLESLLEENRKLKIEKTEIEEKMEHGCDGLVEEWKSKMENTEEKCVKSISERNRAHAAAMEELHIEVEMLRETLSEGGDGEHDDSERTDPEHLRKEIEELRVKAKERETVDGVVEGLKREAEKLNLEVKVERGRAKRAEEELEQAKRMIERLETEQPAVDALKAKIADLEGNLQEKETAAVDDNAVGELKEQVKKLEEQIAVDNKKAEALRSKLESAEKRSNELQEMMEKQKEEMNDKEEQNPDVAIVQELEAIKEERDSLEDEYELLKSRAEVQVSEIDEGKLKLEKSNQEMEQLKAIQTSHDDEVEGLDFKFRIAVASVVLLLVHEVFLFVRKRPVRKSTSKDKKQSKDKKKQK